MGAPRRTRRSVAASKQRGAARVSLLLALPFAVLLALVGAAVCIAALFGGKVGCGAEATGAVKGVPARLTPIYEQAAARYGLGERGPAILASINYFETDFGANQGPSSAGAEGWMQFLPESWETYGVDADGDGVKDPTDPWDAIFAAARLLRASGAPTDWHAAIFSYNHADWYVAEVEARAASYQAGPSGAAATTVACASAGANAHLSEAETLYRPRAFKAIPADLWVGGGAPESVDSRIWPDVVWVLQTYDLRVSAARETGHNTHGDGTAVDLVPAPGKGWDETARRVAEDLGWRESCAVSGTAPVCPIAPAIQFIGYNGYPGHGDPAHAGSNAHLHISWKGSSFGCAALCPPPVWVWVFPLSP